MRNIEPVPASESTTRRLRNPTASPDVLAAVRRRLHKSAYPPLRALESEFHEGVVTLRGRVTSHHLKQMAQESVRHLAGVDEVANRIEVVERLPD